MESNQKDIERLIELSQNEKRVKQKLVYDSVLLFLEGYKRSEVSKILHVKQGTVNDHIRKYLKNGIDSLHIQKQPGYQKRLTDEQETELAEVITTQTPEEAGSRTSQAYRRRNTDNITCSHTGWGRNHQCLKGGYILFSFWFFHNELSGRTQKTNLNEACPYRKIQSCRCQYDDKYRIIHNIIDCTKNSFHYYSPYFCY